MLIQKPTEKTTLDKYIIVYPKGIMLSKAVRVLVAGNSSFLETEDMDNSGGAAVTHRADSLKINSKQFTDFREFIKMCRTMNEEHSLDVIDTL